MRFCIHKLHTISVSYSNRNVAKNTSRFIAMPICNSRTFLCKICGNKFFTKDQMNTHYLRRHTNKTPFQCPYCKKKFNAMANCNKHIETACSTRFQKKSAKIKRTN